METRAFLRDDVISKVIGSECAYCSGTLVTGKYKGDDAAVCDECGTPAVRSWRQSSSTTTIIVPTYNERENAPLLIDSLHSELGDHRDYTILIVDDDSPDGTGTFIQEDYAKNPRVEVLIRTGDRGLGPAVLDGMRHASSDALLVMDADLQHPPGRVSMLLEALETADIAIGTRYSDGGGTGDWSLARRAVSLGATAIAALAVPSSRDVSDPMSGFFAVRSDVVGGAALRPKGFKILLEILARGDYEEVAEVPYVFGERMNGASNLTATEYMNFAEHCAELAIDSAPVPVSGGRAVRFAKFGAVGAAGTVVNMVAFAAALLLGGTVLVAGAIAFMVAMTVNFIGNWVATYGRPDVDVSRSYGRFALASLVGAAVYLTVLSIAAGLMHPLVANVLAILAGALGNFVGVDEFVFKQGVA